MPRSVSYQELLAETIRNFVVHKKLNIGAISLSLPHIYWDYWLV